MLTELIKLDVIMRLLDLCFINIPREGKRAANAAEVACTRRPKTSQSHLLSSKIILTHILPS